MRGIFVYYFEYIIMCRGNIGDFYVEDVERILFFVVVSVEKGDIFYFFY